MPKASRLKSSMTLNSLKLHPSSNWSCKKSMDHTWLIACGMLKGSGLSRTSLLRGLIRRFSSSSQSMRYTRLLFQPKPLTLRQVQVAQAKAPIAVVVS